MGDRVAKNLLLAAGFAAFSASAVLAQPAQPMPNQTGPVPVEAPAVRIANGLIEAKIYLIDSGKGFYRGTRFDQAGVVGSLVFGGQDFYGAWFDRTSPEVMDYIFTPEGIVGGPDSAVSGPVEEFAPIGFDQAAPGETFLKIGVGLLRKPDTAPYDHYHLYDIVDAGERTVQSTKSTVTFTQAIAGVVRYTKTLRLIPGRPELRIEHVLTNSGNSAISTTVYDHNFLKLSPGNADIAVHLPFPVAVDKTPDVNQARIDPNGFTYLRALADKETVSFHVTGFGKAVGDYDIGVSNLRTGAGVRVTADEPMTRLNVWSIRSVMAIEPYIDLNLPPGATKRWAYRYVYRAPKQAKP